MFFKENLSSTLNELGELSVNVVCILKKQKLEVLLPSVSDTW